MSKLRDSVFCRNSESSMRDDSIKVADILDKLGYRKLLVEKRAQIYKTASKGSRLLYSRKSKENVDLIVGGARGEGIGICLDTDVDKLFVLRSVKCFESQQGLSAKYSETIQLYFDTENVPNGYTKLVLNNVQEKSADENLTKRVKEALVNINGKSYLQNNYIITDAALGRKVLWEKGGWLTRNLKVPEERKGPSKPYFFPIPYTGYSFPVDDVLAFQCCCPKLISNWSDRKRTHDWPSQALIQRVKDKDVLVVPVGVEGHADEKIQWRISFSLGELELVWSFNDTQIKVYALLKMLARSQLKDVCQKITSYVMKNVFFWLLEETYMKTFYAENIISIVILALDKLHKNISERNIPNYMIPERNHFEGITERERIKLLERLDALVSDRKLYLKCPIVKDLLSVSNCEAKKIVIEREVGEQIMMAAFSFEPEYLINVLKHLFEAKTEEAVINVLKTDVIAVRRREDPFDFFSHIKEMTDDELISIFFKKSTKSKSKL